MFSNDIYERRNNVILKFVDAAEGKNIIVNMDNIDYFTVMEDFKTGKVFVHISFKHKNSSISFYSNIEDLEKTMSYVNAEIQKQILANF